MAAADALAVGRAGAAGRRSGAVEGGSRRGGRRSGPVGRRSGVIRLLLIAVALLFLGLFLVLPLLVVFVQALAKGVGAYAAAITDPIGWAAVKLTLIVAAVAVPCNLVF